MNRKIYRFCLLLSLIHLVPIGKVFAQKTLVILKGKVLNLPSNTGNYAYVVTGGSAETVSFHRTQIKNNQFQLNLPRYSKDSLVVAFLFISQLPTMYEATYRKNLKDLKRHRFLIDTTEIKVKVNYADKWAAINGGELNRQDREFNLVDSTYHAMYKQQKVDERYRHTGNFLADLNRYRTLEFARLIMKYNSSPLSLKVVSYIANMPVPKVTYHNRKEIREALDSFSTEIKATERYKKVYDSFEMNLKKNEPKSGLLFPQIALISKGKTPVPFMDVYAGKEYVLIDFWATWCGPCIQQHPIINKLGEKFKDSNIQMVGISVDQKLEAWDKYLLKHSFSYPQYRFDPKDKKMLEEMGALKLPTYTLVEKSSGKVVEYDILVNDLERTLEKYKR
jgi:thiol-disulfide isomerase/thioredoxin